MFTFGYNSRKGTLLKTLVVLAFGIAGVATRTVFGRILGIVLIAIAVRDLFRLLTARPEKEGQTETKKEEAQPAAREDGLKITDLSEAKEVEYQKAEGNYTKE